MTMEICIGLLTQKKEVQTISFPGCYLLLLLENTALISCGDPNTVGGVSIDHHL